MTLVEFYAVVGGDLNEVLRRLPSEAFIKKFLNRFPNDTSFSELKAAIEAEDVKAAFSAAHTLKGVSRNLGLGKLGDSASALTEETRGGSFGNAEALFETVQADYKDAMRALEELNG